MNENTFVVKSTSRNYGLFREKKPLLQHIDLELTERCNNNCIHCYINLPENDANAINKELTTDDWKDILDQAADLGAISVRFTGGESLLRQDFVDLYLHARRLGMKVIIFTNARLITADLADLFAKIPPLKKIEITSYGMHSRSYDAVTRSPGAFEEFMRGIDLLIKRQIPFMVKSSFLPPNVPEVDEFRQWTKPFHNMDQRLTYAVLLDLRTHRDSASKNELIRKLRLHPEKAAAFLAQDKEEYRKSMVPFVKNYMHPSGDRLFNCGAGESGCVDAYGNYQVCMMLRHPDTVYNLTKGTLKEAIKEFFPSIYEMRATNPDYLSRCARCFLKGLCEQCPAKSWAEHGTLDTPVEYYCQVAHAQARILGLISGEEKAWEIVKWQDRVKEFLFSVGENDI